MRFKSTILVAATILFLCSGPRIALANFLSSHQYLEYEYDATMDGAYEQNVYGQEDLINPNLSLQNVNGEWSLIDKEMWLLVDYPQGTQSCDNGMQYGCWIETGDTAGVVVQAGGNVPQHGHFFAIARNDGSYYEEPIGPTGVTGSHTFEILYDPNTTGVWDIYVDAALARQITSMNQFRWGFAFQSGIESNNDQNSFVSGTYQNQIEYEDSTEAWYYWGTPVARNSLTYLPGANASFSNNQLTFVHN